MTNCSFPNRNHTSQINREARPTLWTTLCSSIRTENTWGWRYNPLHPGKIHQGHNFVDCRWRKQLLLVHIEKFVFCLKLDFMKCELYFPQKNLCISVKCSFCFWLNSIWSLLLACIGSADLRCCTDLLLREMCYLWSLPCSVGCRSCTLRVRFSIKPPGGGEPTNSPWSTCRLPSLKKTTIDIIIHHNRLFGKKKKKNKSSQSARRKLDQLSYFRHIWMLGASGARLD